jgi:hypothetical protein
MQERSEHESLLLHPAALCCIRERHRGLPQELPSNKEVDLNCLNDVVDHWEWSRWDIKYEWLVNTEQRKHREAVATMTGCLHQLRDRYWKRTLPLSNRFYHVPCQITCSSPSKQKNYLLSYTKPAKNQSHELLGKLPFSSLDLSHQMSVIWL